MKKLALLFVLSSVILLSFDFAKKISQQQSITQSDIDSSELILVFDTKFVIAHGWGYVYDCSVQKALKGSFLEKSISLTIGVGDYVPEFLERTADQPTNILAAGFVQIKNENPYVSSSGFMDEKNKTWSLVFLKKI